MPRNLSKLENKQNVKNTKFRGKFAENRVSFFGSSKKLEKRGGRVYSIFIF